MTAFKVIVLFVTGISAFGSIAGNGHEKRDYLRVFAVSGALFLLSLVIERM